MKIKKGDRFRDYVGSPCFISYIRGDVVKLTYLGDGHVETWDKQEFLYQINLNRFHPQPKPPINRETITAHLIEYQLNMVGKTTEDAKRDEKWYYNITMTTKQYELFKGYAIPLIKKVFKVNKTKAEGIFGWFNLQYGLRVQD